MAKKYIMCNHPDCEYAQTIRCGNRLVCDYILIERKSRGCKATEDCNKYKKRTKKKKYKNYQTGYIVYDNDPDVDAIEEVEELTNEMD